VSRLHLRVVEVIRETDDAHSLILEPVDPQVPFVYKPGQFLTLRIPTEWPQGAARSYSLSSSPHCDDKPAITVKRVRDGYGSNWICDNVVEGHVLEALPPSGTFTPRTLDEDVLLLAAGSGITPVLSILKSVLSAGTGSVILIYANRDERSVIFRDELDSLARQHGDRLSVVHWLESVQGLPTGPALNGLLRDHTHRVAYVCGPGSFMTLAADTLGALGVRSERTHVERFVSIQGDPFTAQPVALDAAGDTAELEVTLDGTTTTLAWPRRNKLLDVLLDAGLKAPFSCREGACSACACMLLDGEVDLEANQVLDQKDLAEGIILCCQAVPRTSRVAVSYDL